jgi:hypothetical protein
MGEQLAIAIEEALGGSSPPVEIGLAVYGAVVGTIALAWEIFRWKRSRRPDVLVVPGGERTIDGVWLVALVVNRGSHPIRVAGWGAYRAGFEREAHPRFDESDLPPIPPSDAARVRRPVDELPNIEVNQHIVVSVELTAGDRFTSKPFTWPARLLPLLLPAWAA